MIIDSSAIIAILFGEPEAKMFFEVIEQSDYRLMGAPTLLEAAIVAKSKKGPDVLPRLDLLLDQLEVKTLSFSAEHAKIAKQAFLKYGKGQGHSAQLNFGDCMCYAMSKVEALPLLFKGNDFMKTDVKRVI
jgi:ribonuclease VapC